jgi:hypothetical protein
VERIGSSIFVFDDNRDTYAGGNDIASYLCMSQEDKRKLVLAVLPAQRIVGKPAGVYVQAVEGEGNGKQGIGARLRHRPKEWSIRIRGRLDFEMVLSAVGGLEGSPGQLGKQPVQH